MEDWEHLIKDHVILEHPSFTFVSASVPRNLIVLIFFAVLCQTYFSYSRQIIRAVINVVVCVAL